MKASGAGRESARPVGPGAKLIEAFCWYVEVVMGSTGGWRNADWN